MADFLIALADFDRRRGWEALGHASLFGFINSELGLSPAPTFWRSQAARLLQDFPELIEPLRQGRLCLTTMGELAKVLTGANKETVLPRFLGISSREAKEIVAELQPRESPPMRTVVRPLAPDLLRFAPAPTVAFPPSEVPAGLQATAPSKAAQADPESLWAPKVELTHPARVEPRRDEVDPLTAELSRLSTTVSRRFLQKLKAARGGLTHAIPGATTEQVLEVALDLLLEKQAKARGQVKRPRSVAATITPTTPVPSTPTSSQGRESAETPGLALPLTLSLPSTSTDPTTLEPTYRRTGARETIPAAVRRAVWERDAGRCSWPLDQGGTCDSTHRLELDHIVPWAMFGGRTEDDLRLLCGLHNRLAARKAFGDRCIERYASGRGGGAR